MAVTTLRRTMAVGLAAGCMITGCMYSRDRGRDLCDVVTLSVEDHKYGACVMIAIPLGFDYSNGRGFGLRDGYAGKYGYSENVFTFGYAALWGAEFHPDDDQRGKGYTSTSDPHGDPPLEKPWRYCGTVGATVGLYYGIRAGVNLLELTDFLLGWTTYDLLNDDEASLRLKRGAAENKGAGQ